MDDTENNEECRGESPTGGNGIKRGASLLFFGPVPVCSTLILDSVVVVDNG